MRTAPLVVVLALLTAACGSSSPPKTAEPEPAPLFIPPLPPQKEPAARPAAREVPPSPPPAAEEADAEPGGAPSPLALPCKSDAECMTHRCNRQVQRCAFPCKSDRDCIAGATCYVAGGALATCIPKSP